ncbi:MAG: GC-type dockerin domain-anchored protein [Phycisphaerales bacterium]
MHARHTIATIGFLLTPALVAGPAPAQELVAPSANTNASGDTGLNTLIRNAAGRTYQWRIASAELAGVPVGSFLDAITYRFDQTGSNPTTWPPAGGATWTAYDITLSQDATSGAALSPTFAVNQTAPVRVRSGPLTIPAGTFTSGANPNAWGHRILFDTPYQYAGGGLLVTVAHPGSNQVPVAPFLDATNIAGNAISGSSFVATAGTPTASTIVRVLSCDRGITTVPNAATNAEGADASPSLLAGFGNARTYQVQYAASQLTALQPGDIITSLGIRLDQASQGLAPWPPAGGATWAAYEITLSRAANTVAGLSTTLAANQVDPVLVRGGPLTIPAGSIIANPLGPDPFFEVPIKPYAYQGGDLVVTITHTGSSIASAPLVDAVPASAVAGARASNGYQSQSGTASQPLVLSIRTMPAQAPGVLWDNGGIVNRPGLGTGGADLSAIGFRDSLLGFTALSGGERVADDIVINDIQGWRLDAFSTFVFAHGDSSGSTSIINGLAVRVWNGVPESPGASIVAQTNPLASNTFANAYRDPASAISNFRPVRRLTATFPQNTVLPRGRYWIEIACTSTFSTPMVVPVQNYCGHMPGNALARSGAGVWAQALDPANSAGVEFPFLLVGAVRECRADLTSTAILGSAGYGVPNAILNTDDFFFYLTAFAAGNRAVADLTTTAIPGSPGFGVPNGTLNNDDFFFYLTLFAAGC